MQKLAEKILTALPSMNFEKYWDGFQGNAYAIYDDNEVYLFNHPKCGDQPYISFPKNNQFVSCTYILFEAFPTAIVDIRYFDNFEDIYSLIVHESFHAYQHELGESRFPNEAIGPTYPTDFRFIQLRIRERQVLHNAVFENSKGTQHELINEFITLRNERIRLFPAIVDYENRVETIEGPAFFVEYQALRDIGNSETALERYASMLIDAEDSHIYIRKSCYSSGLFLCLLLDRLSFRWQEDFMHAELDLYHFFKTLYTDFVPVSMTTHHNKNEVEGIIKSIQDHKKEAFEAFTGHSGIPLTLTGTMKVAGFDPMNITIQENQALHKHFLKFRIGSAEYFIKGPVLTHFGTDFMTINSLEVFIEKLPVELDNELEIEGIGNIKGSIDYADGSSVRISLI